MKRNDLLSIRNDKIYQRYKELYDIKCLRHKKVLELLTTEFYLGVVHLEKIILDAKKSLSNKDVKV